MMYPANWVSKHLQDAKRNSVPVELVDTISVPLIEFLYE